MARVVRWGDPLDGPVGLRWRRENVRNLSDDQQYIIDQLKLIPANQGGKKEEWTTAPLPGPSGRCAPDLVDAIFDFQQFWKSQGKLQIVDGVVDRQGPTLRQMEWAVEGMAYAPDPLKAKPPEGQMDANACWAACYAWWLRAAPGQTARAQIQILADGAASGGMVNGDGTVNVNGFMTFLSGRHMGMRSSQINPVDLTGFLAGSRLPSFPVIIGFGSSIMGGHVNVIHAFDKDKSEVSVMECWYPDPSTNPNYDQENAGGLPVFVNKRTKAPFKFLGAHVTRPVNHYVSRPFRGKLLVFPDNV